MGVVYSSLLHVRAEIHDERWGAEDGADERSEFSFIHSLGNLLWE